MYGEFPFGHFVREIPVTQSRTEGPTVKIEDLEGDRDSYAY